MNNDLLMNKPKTNRSFKEMLSIFFYEVFRYPLKLISHPIGEWDDFKREKKGKMWVSIFYLVMMIFTVVCVSLFSGFLVNKNDPNEFNLLLTISLILFPVGLGTVGNWCITALFDGKGSMVEIFKVICYSFFPYVWLGLFATIFSNYIILDEVAYINFFFSIAIFFTCYMMFFGLMSIHEYGLLKNILTIISTFIAIAIIIFIALLFLSLIQQMSGWINAIYQEIKMRYL